MEKKIFTSILSGALFAATFVLAKKLFSKVLLNSPSEDLSVPSKVKTEFTHKKVTPSADICEKKLLAEKVCDPVVIFPTKESNEKFQEHLFYMDYPKSNLPNSTSIISNGVIMIDALAFTQNYDIELLFNRDKNTITLIHNDNTLIFNMITGEVKFNNSSIETEQFAIVRDDTLFIPLPLTAEMFGIKVKNNDLDRIFTIGG